MSIRQRIRARILNNGAQVRGIQEALESHWERLERQAHRIAQTEKSTRATAKEAELHVREMNRIAPQLAALESKVENLRQALEAAPTVDGEDDISRARNIVHEVRREHEQIRVRLSAVTSYEERLRRIEESLNLPHD